MNSIDRPDPGGLRGHVRRLLTRSDIQTGILVLIIVNAAVLGLQTSPSLMAYAGDTIVELDRVILGVFVVELALRLFAYRGAFFRDPWSLFDMLVIGTALIPANAHFAVLRALRVLRVLRIATVAPSMRRVVGSLLAAIPGLGAIATVLLLIFYVFAVIATHVFGEAFPAWFGHVGRSLYTLFQVMTLESWSMGISRPVMEQFPYAWLFFVPFILVATFTMLNLFIAVIVNATQAYAEAEKEQTLAALDDARVHIERDLHAEVAALRTEIAELKTMLERPRA